MSWPGRITDVGGIRRQFHHIIDIVPTILEATGISAPDMVNGIPQRPIEGVSMAYTWDKAKPSILQKSYTITAEVEIPAGGAEGMIVTQGGRFGGYGLFLSKGEFGFRRGKPVFLYNLLDLKRTIWDGPELSPGKHTIVFDFKFDGGGYATARSTGWNGDDTAHQRHCDPGLSPVNQRGQYHRARRYWLWLRGVRVANGGRRLSDDASWTAQTRIRHGRGQRQ